MKTRNTFYFNHDYSARNDQKILMLLAKYRWEGYGLYWACLEAMAEDSTGLILLKSIPGLEGGLRVAEGWLKPFLDYCVSPCELFEIDEDGNYFSRRMLEHKIHRENLSKSGKKGVETRVANARLKGGLSVAQATDSDSPSLRIIQQQRIGEERKQQQQSHGIPENTDPADPAAAAAFSFLAETLGMDLIQVSQVFKNHKLPYIQDKIALTRKRVEAGHLENAAGFFLSALARDFKDNSDVSKKIEAAKELAKEKAKSERRRRVEMKLEAGLSISHQEYGLLLLEQQEGLQHDAEHFKVTGEWIYFDPKQKGEPAHEEG